MSDEQINNDVINEGDGVRFDDDDIKLPADTLTILNEFLRNRNQAEQLELQIDGNNTNDTFEEDWVRVNCVNRDNFRI